MLNTPTEAILRNEGTSKRKNPSLPSGTFTTDGSPTIVLDVIGVKVAGEILMGSNPKRIRNSQIFKREVVDCLDSLGLLPINITKEQKTTKIGQLVSWMVTEQKTIKSTQINLYAASRKSYRKAMTSLKIAAKS
jgi:hypothetical protein